MKEYKIMITDDEPDILNLLEKSLQSEGFQHILKAGSGPDAIAMCRKFCPDILILDIMLPGIDGYEVCRQIRQFSHCPILFLSARNEELDKLLGLAVGGDDYVTKPFSPKEVAYRVKAQLRRIEYQDSELNRPSLSVGALVIDSWSCQVTKQGREIPLTAREFEILQYMAQNQGRVISRERLYETVWGEDGYGCDNTVMVHIRHLREKLEDNPAEPEYLVTVKGLGYKLVNPYEK